MIAITPITVIHPIAVWISFAIASVTHSCVGSVIGVGSASVGGITTRSDANPSEMMEKKIVERATRRR